MKSELLYAMVKSKGEQGAARTLYRQGVGEHDGAGLHSARSLTSDILLKFSLCPFSRVCVRETRFTHRAWARRAGPSYDRP